MRVRPFSLVGMAVIVTASVTVPSSAADAARTSLDPPAGCAAHAINDRGVAVGGGCAQDRRGTFVILDRPDSRGSFDVVYAGAISTRGEIVGAHVWKIDDLVLEVPLVWASMRSPFQELPLPPGSAAAEAVGVDDARDVLVADASSGEGLAWVWAGGRYTSISNWTGGVFSTATRLSTRGDLLDTSAAGGTDAGRVWHAGRVTVLRIPAECHLAVADALGGNGSAAGRCLGGTPPMTRPIAWSPTGAPRVLPLPPGAVEGQALASARHGYAAGMVRFGDNPPGGVRAVRWRKDRVEVLSPSSALSFADGINSKGEVVGTSDDPPLRSDWIVWPRHG